MPTLIPHPHPHPHPRPAPARPVRQVRARALEVFGLLASADGGREALGPVLHDTMRAAVAGFDLDYAELREYAHGASGYATGGRADGHGGGHVGV